MMQSDHKIAWGLVVPQQGVKEKSGLTVEGHRPLFMQRSDPLAQRSFSCWQTGGKQLNYCLFKADPNTLKA
jgi:hypothetical protein